MLREQQPQQEERMPSSIELVQGDITREVVDAIVNAANTGLVGGGGVDGAIHRAGGPAIMAECERIRAGAQGPPCPIGTVVETTAGRLQARAVLHTAGPRWRGGKRGEAEQLASCYRSCLDAARRRGYRTVAFPSISTGIYGYPIEQAAEVALRTVGDQLQAHGDAFDVIRFVLFSAADLDTYRRTLAKFQSSG
jgi:O-acetyl-ADP-ribose deacetylase (regulator of RNase III)